MATVDEKRQKYLEAKARFGQTQAAHPAMKPNEVKLMLIKQRLAAMMPHGKWEDRGLPILSRQWANRRRP